MKIRAILLVLTIIDKLVDALLIEQQPPNSIDYDKIF